MIRSRGTRRHLAPALLPVAATVAACVAFLPAAVAATGAPGAPVATRAVTVGCHGSGCLNKNPTLMHCDHDAVTLRIATWNGGHAAGGTYGQMGVQVRYSPACNASWSRVQSIGTGTAHVTRAQAWLKGRPATSRINLAGTSAFSLMVGGHTTPACGNVRWNHGAVVHTLCVAPPH